MLLVINWLNQALQLVQTIGQHAGEDHMLNSEQKLEYHKYLIINPKS